MQLLDDRLVETRWSVALFLLHTVSSPFLAGIPGIRNARPSSSTGMHGALIDSVV
jgi:hypothetical protein